MSDAPNTGPDDGWWTDEPDATPRPERSAAGGRRWWAIAGAAVLVVGAAVGGVVVATSSKHSTKVGASGSGATSSTANGSANGATNGAPGDGLAGGAARGLGGRRRPGAQGTITAISGKQLTIATAGKGAVKVVVTPSTTITDTTKASLADLKAGDHVIAIGAAGTSGTVTAQSVIDSRDMTGGFGFGRGGARGPNGPPGGGGGFSPGSGGAQGGTPPTGRRFPGGAGGFTVGTISSINGSTVVVKTAAGTSVNVMTTSTTTVRLTTKIAFSKLAKGDKVAVTGATANGTLTATAIRRGDEGFGVGGLGRRRLGGATTTTTP